MNHRRLSHDLAADAILTAARRRKRKHFTRPVILLATLALTSLWFLPRNPSSQPMVTVKIESSSVPVGRMEIIESDEELLVLLEEFGPVLAEEEDGTKTLLLTANY